MDTGNIRFFGFNYEGPMGLGLTIVLIGILSAVFCSYLTFNFVAANVTFWLIPVLAALVVLWPAYFFTVMTITVLFALVILFFQTILN